jgi:hypothetical protein
VVERVAVRGRVRPPRRPRVRVPRPRPVFVLAQVPLLAGWSTRGPPGRS